MKRGILTKAGCALSIAMVLAGGCAQENSNTVSGNNGEAQTAEEERVIPEDGIQEEAFKDEEYGEVVIQNEDRT